MNHYCKARRNKIWKQWKGTNDSDIGQYNFELIEQFRLVKRGCDKQLQVTAVASSCAWSIRAIYSGEMDNKDKGIMHQTLFLHFFDESYKWVIAYHSKEWLRIDESSL